MLEPGGEWGAGGEGVETVSDQFWQEPLILMAQRGGWAFPPFPDGAESRMFVQEPEAPDGLGL